jgi:murein L,D-transpeptidase YcbB/YkuD
VRAYLAQLRQADAAEIIAQAFSVLASAAEVKLGRRDARLLIDMAANVAETAGGRLDERITKQMEQAVSQLRLAQVDAEKQLEKMRAEGQIPDEEEGDLEAAGTQPEAVEPDRTEGPSAASRLWIPGR